MGQNTPVQRLQCGHNVGAFTSIHPPSKPQQNAYVECYNVAIGGITPKQTRALAA
jgi:hypothetical protein